MSVRIVVGDCREKLAEMPDESVHCVVTSPPYWGLRDYGVAGQIGLEADFRSYIDEMVAVFREVRRVVRDDGTLWLNLGDSYAGGGKGGGGSFEAERPGWRASNAKSSTLIGGKTTVTQQNRNGLGAVQSLKPKDLVGIPWRVAFALQHDGADIGALRVIERLRTALLADFEDWSAIPDRTRQALDALDLEYAEAKGNSWFLRQDIIWSKPNPMPESVADRCTKAHEYLFLLSKRGRYYFDADAIAEPASYGSHGGREANPGDKARTTGGHSGSLGLTPKQRQSKKRGEFNGKTNALPGREAFRAITETRNRRSVWEVATNPFPGAHFATFPPGLIEPCILAGSPRDGTVLDCFGGAGTTGLVADRLGRNAILLELNPEYAAMARRRIENDAPLIAEVA